MPVIEDSIDRRSEAYRRNREALAGLVADLRRHLERAALGGSEAARRRHRERIKEQWGKLTDDDFKIIEGNRDQLAGRVQERYGLAKDETKRQIDSFRSRNTDLWPMP